MDWNREAWNRPQQKQIAAENWLRPQDKSLSCFRVSPGSGLCQATVRWREGNLDQEWHGQGVGIRPVVEKLISLAPSPGNTQSLNLLLAGWGPQEDKGMSLKATQLEKMEGEER